VSTTVNDPQAPAQSIAPPNLNKEIAPPNLKEEVAPPDLRKDDASLNLRKKVIIQSFRREVTPDLKKAAKKIDQLEVKERDLMTKAMGETEYLSAARGGWK
jgi:hypothetical protein